VAVYVWQQELEPDFPLAVLEYASRGDGDRMHWHDHLEIAVVLEAEASSLGQRALAAEISGIFIDTGRTSRSRTRGRRPAAPRGSGPS
jgi:hypothetical protein